MEKKSERRKKQAQYSRLVSTLTLRSERKDFLYPRRAFIGERLEFGRDMPVFCAIFGCRCVKKKPFCKPKY